MSMTESFVLAAARIALFAGCRTVALPILYGQARYAALESSSATATKFGSTNTGPNSSVGLGIGLPSPATASSTRSTSAAWSSASGRRELIAGLVSSASLVSILFSISMEEVTLLFVLVLLDAAGWNKGLLRANWNISLLSTITFAVVLIPLGICLLLTMQGPSSSFLRKFLWSFLPYGLWLILFLKVPMPANPTTDDPNAGTESFWSWITTSALLRTAVIGVTLLAMLSGSAAMAAAWDAYDDLLLFRTPRDGRRSGAVRVSADDVIHAQASFDRTMTDLDSKRNSIDRLEAEAAAPIVPGAQAPPPSLLGRINPWTSTPSRERAREIKVLRSEVWALESLAKNMRDDLDALRERERRVNWSKTWSGRLLISMGWVFAIYCIFRIGLSLLQLLILGYKDTAPPDFISYGLAWLLHLLAIDADVSVWARQISLGFIGLLIAMRMRAVLQYLSSAFKAASTGTSSSFLVLFLAEISVLYLLATLIQLRATLPVSTPNNKQPLLSTLPPFQVVFGSLFDSAFLLAATATCLLKWLSHKTDLDHGGTLLLSSARD